MKFAQPTSATNREVPLFIPDSKPEPAKLDTIYEQILQIFELAQKWKQITPLLNWFNSLDVARSGDWTADEIQEAVDELELGHLEKFLAEWADSLNLAAGLVQAKNLDIHFTGDVLPYVNGQGRKSNVYEQAQEVAVNFSPRDEVLRRDIIEVYTLMCSGLIHAPQFTADLVKLAIEKMQDNLKNYPTRLFGVLNEFGKMMNPDKLKLKYTHIIKCLKWLRSLQPGRMLPDDWDKVEDCIVAFQSSDESFRMLQTRWFELHPEALAVLKPQPTEMPQQVVGNIAYAFQGIPHYV